MLVHNLKKLDHILHDATFNLLYAMAHCKWKTIQN